MKNLSSKNHTNMANQKFQRTNLTFCGFHSRSTLIGLIVLTSIFMCFGPDAWAEANNKALPSNNSKVISVDKPLRDKKNRESFKTIIEIKENAISIDVENANLFDVLDEIGLKAGVKITIEKNVINNKITAKYKGEEIETALKGILGKNYAFVFSKDLSAPKKYRLKEVRVVEMSLLNAINKESGTQKDLTTSSCRAQIRSLVDSSMAEINGRYKGHQEIRDAQGRIIKYSYFYSIGKKSTIQNMEQIYQDVSNAEAKRKDGQRLLAEAEAESDETKLKAAAKLLVQGDRELIREKDFATVSIAATTDHPPLLSFQYGLPDWVITHDSAMELAQEKSGEECTLKEIRQQGLIGVIFVFETQSGRALYVDPKQSIVFTKMRVVEDRKKKSRRSVSMEEERNHRIRAQWKEFLERGFDPKKFTLSDLIDLSKKGMKDEKTMGH